MSISLETLLLFVFFTTVVVLGYRFGNRYYIDYINLQKAQFLADFVFGNRSLMDTVTTILNTYQSSSPNIYDTHPIN
jgi:hypothetical protein